MITYRKTQGGEWVAFGPTDEVQVGQVTVTKRGGEQKTECVERVGKDFNVGGVPHRYGYLAKRRTNGSPLPRRRSRGTRTGCSCGSVEEYTKPSDCWTCKHDA